MHFSTAGLLSALLVGLVASAPAEFEDRSPDSNPAPPIPSAPAAITPKVVSQAATLVSPPTPVVSEPSTPVRNKCSQKECPKGCDIGNSTEKRSIENFDYNHLTKRFYENPDPDKFPYSLLEQYYTTNICPESPATNTYIYRKLSTQRRQYAAALQGLCGCTTIIVASGNGVFSSHIWEEDLSNDPPRDLQPANYQATLTDLTNNLTPYQDSLAGGQAFLIIPKDPDNVANYLYGNAIVNALITAISDASGIMPAITTYIPLDFETSDELTTNRRGTASFEFDPAYQAGGMTSRAYRVISEGRVLALQTNL